MAEQKINFCTGCGLCIYHDKPCPQKDDVEAIQQKMSAADLIVMATPVYFYSICAQLKMLIDRLCAYNEKMRGKPFGFIMTSEDGDPACMDRPLETFRGYLVCLKDVTERFVLRAAGVTHLGDAAKSPYMEEAYELGKSL